MTATAQPSRESFFALHWDHVRSIPRLALMCLAKIPKERQAEIECGELSWDLLHEHEREGIREAILFLVECHDHTRQEAARRRELQGKAA